MSECYIDRSESQLEPQAGLADRANGAPEAQAPGPEPKPEAADNRSMLTSYRDARRYALAHTKQLAGELQQFCDELGLNPLELLQTSPTESVGDRVGARSGPATRTQASRAPAATHASAASKPGLAKTAPRKDDPFMDAIWAAGSKGVRAEELRRALGLDSPEVKRFLQAAMEQKLIRSVGKARGVRYYAK